MTNVHSKPVFKAPSRAAVGDADLLVGLGFRLWLTGARTGEIAYWERVWNAYCDAMGSSAARTAVTQLAKWVRSIQQTTRREIALCPTACRGFCADECMAIAMVAACQHSACPAMRACAQQLLGCARIERVIDEAGNLAAALRTANQLLSPPSIGVAGPVATHLN